MKATEQQQIDQALKATLKMFLTSLYLLALCVLLFVRAAVSLVVCLLTILTYSLSWLVSRIVSCPELRDFALSILK